MDDESGGSIVELIYLLFIKGHTWPEFLFLYASIHITLSLNYKFVDYWNMGADYIHSKNDAISVLIFKPFMVVLVLAFPVLIAMLYTLILAVMASLFFEYIPSILPAFSVGHLKIFEENFKMPEFSIKKMVFEASFLNLLVYFFCYTGLRNKEVYDLKNKN